MKIYNSIKILELIEEAMPYSFESLQDEIDIAMAEDNPHEFVAIDSTIHIFLKDIEDISHMISLFINAFTEEVLVYTVEVSGDVYSNVVSNKKEAALYVLDWIRENSLVLDHVVHTEKWDDDMPIFKYDSIIDVANKLSKLK